MLQTVWTLASWSIYATIMNNEILKTLYRNIKTSHFYNENDSVFYVHLKFRAENTYVVSWPHGKKKPLLYNRNF
jgi:hypothetical protein